MGHFFNKSDDGKVLAETSGRIFEKLEHSFNPVEHRFLVGKYKYNCPFTSLDAIMILDVLIKE